MSQRGQCPLAEPLRACARGLYALEAGDEHLCYVTLIPSAETSLTTSEGATGQGCRDLTRGGDP